jgi:GNAT superfamily N-acetyltransferase
VSLTVVRISPSHSAFGAVAALFDDYRAHGWPPSPQLTHDWLHAQVTRQAMMITAALRSGRACGFIAVSVMPASLTLGTAWSIRDLYVVPAHHRMGIAGVLLHQVIDDAREAGAHRVSLQTETGNTLRSRSMRRPASSPSPAWNCSASTSHATARNRRARFSAYFWTSSGPGQAACHEDGHGPVDVGFVVGGQAFVVAGAAAVAGDPCQDALDHPAAGQHLEGVGALGPFDDLHVQLQPLLRPGQELAGVAASAQAWRMRRR